MTATATATEHGKAKGTLFTNKSSLVDEYTIAKTQTVEYGVVRKYLIITFSSIASIVYSTILCTGAIVYHYYSKLMGRTKFIAPDLESRGHGYTPRKAYDNLESMTATSDLRYYVREMGLDLEEYDVETPDGFVLVLHHIYDPKERLEVRELRKPTFLQHGLLSCSGAFIATGKNSLAFFLHEAGYDVWLGNNRSWFRAKSAVLKGDLYNNELYWKWGMKELAYYDLPSMISTVMSLKPRHKKLILFGHSQGGLQGFLMLKNPHLEYIHDQIELFVPLAPAIFPGYLFHTRNFIKILCLLQKWMWTMIFGFCAVLRNLCLMRYYISHTWLFGKLSYYMFKFLFRWTNRNWGSNKKIWHFCFIFNMSYVSVELMQYYLGGFNSFGFILMLQPAAAFEQNEEFSAYDVASCTKDDSQLFFPYQKNWFNIDKSKRKVPIFIVVGEEDYLVDGRKLWQHMIDFEPGYTNGVNLEYVSIPTYNHLDVCWAEDIIGTIGYPFNMIIERMAKAAKEREVEEEKLAVSVTDLVPPLVANQTQSQTQTRNQDQYRNTDGNQCGDSAIVVEDNNDLAFRLVPSNILLDNVNALKDNSTSGGLVKDAELDAKRRAPIEVY